MYSYIYEFKKLCVYVCLCSIFNSVAYIFLLFLFKYLDTNLITEDVRDPDVVMSHIESLLGGATDSVCPFSIRALSSTLEVKHVSDQQCFTVSDESRNVHAVRLFPVESCTCPSTTTCCHVLAVRTSVGLQKTVRKHLNLTKLRKNSRFAKYIYLIFVFRTLQCLRTEIRRWFIWKAYEIKPELLLCQRPDMALRTQIIKLK